MTQPVVTTGPSARAVRVKEEAVRRPRGVDVKHHVYLLTYLRPRLPDPNSPYSLCGREAMLKLELSLAELRSCVKVEANARC